MKTAQKEGILPWLLPDTKAQVTVEYVQEQGRDVPRRVHTVVLTAQHTPEVTVEELRKEILEKVIRKAIPSKYLDNDTVYHVSLPSLPFLN